MHLELHFKNQDRIFEVHEGPVPYLSFRSIDETGMFANAFTTRYGGVSEGYLSSMNMTFKKEGEKRERVLENFRRIGEAAGFHPDRMVMGFQMHTANVREVTEADAGKGISIPGDGSETDGLVTNVPGLTLTVVVADCVPIYFADPVKRAIGLCHSGWRGTVAGIGALTLRKLNELYGSRPEDVICCIGPSICRDCFEVGEEVAEEFRAAFPESSHTKVIFGPCKDAERRDKYHIDLWKANELLLLSEGVRSEHIQVTNLCTHCEPEAFWSHRRLGPRRGNMAAFLMIKESQ